MYKFTVLVSRREGLAMETARLSRAGAPRRQKRPAGQKPMDDSRHFFPLPSGPQQQLRALKFGQHLVGNINVGVDALHIVEVFERLDQAH